MRTILGIDEAGRGPVLGPLVMAGALVGEDAVQTLQELGVKDSKFLTPKKREELYPKILKIVRDWKVISIPPNVIDGAVKSQTSNLNWLEAQTSAEIVNALAPNSAIIDCPSPNIPAYYSFIANLIKDKQTKLILEHNAEKHMPVAAASIIAKVTRDRIIEDLKKQVGIDFGSGYLTDEKTQGFLKKYFQEHSYLFRKTWEPYVQLVQSKAQKKLGQYQSE